MKRNLDDRQFTAWVREVDMRLTSESKKEKTARRRDISGDRHAWRASGNSEKGNGGGGGGGAVGTAMRERKCFAIEDIDTLVVS